MMITKTGGFAPLAIHRSQAEENESQTSGVAQFDRVELTSAQYTAEQRFAHELAGRVAQEVRTHRSDELAQLKEQVQNGTYQYNIDELAARIMLLGGIAE